MDNRRATALGAFVVVFFVAYPNIVGASDMDPYLVSSGKMLRQIRSPQEILDYIQRLSERRHAAGYDPIYNSNYFKRNNADQLRLYRKRAQHTDEEFFPEDEPMEEKKWLSRDAEVPPKVQPRSKNRNQEIRLYKKNGGIRLYRKRDIRLY